MKKFFVILIVIAFSLTVFPQTRFNFDCYQKYKSCVKEGEEAGLFCYTEMCSYEQCICKETTVTNPMTHYEDTDPGAWGTAITVCSPWAQIISDCIKEHYGKSKSKNIIIPPALKQKLSKIIEKLKKINNKITLRRKRDAKTIETNKKLKAQIEVLKKLLKNKNKK